MNRFFTSIALAANLSIAAPAMAGGSSKFKSTLDTSITTPVNVEVVIGEDLAYRADNRSLSLIHI